jgi:hypothetical protein
MKNRGLVITTYNRPTGLFTLLQSIDFNEFDKIVIMHDGGGEPYPHEIINYIQTHSDVISYHPHEFNFCVGRMKWRGIDEILRSEHIKNIFVVEDDVYIKKNAVWDYVEDFCQTIGIPHVNWNNAVSTKVRYHIELGQLKHDVLGDDRTMAATISKDCEGTFQYFTRDIAEKYKIDTVYANAMEHVDLEYRLAQDGVIPPFWNFLSPRYLEEFLEYNGEVSVIKQRKDYNDDLIRAMKRFKDKHGIECRNIPDTPKQEVLDFISSKWYR